MDKFSVQHIQQLRCLDSELELEKASSLFLKLRVLAKEEPKYKDIRTHLAKLIKDYEEKHWSDKNAITDEQVQESDLAEILISLESKFYKRRKEVIKSKLKAEGLNQNDLAKLLGHNKSYVSELVNGLRPLSKEDIILIHRLFKIKLDDLVPPFIKADKVLHIEKTLDSLSHHNIKLSKKDLELN